MKITIRLFSPKGDFLEELEIQDRPVGFILYRGRLFQRIPLSNNFIQRQYLEID